MVSLTKAHGFNDHHLGHISLVGLFFVLFFLFRRAHKFVDAYTSCSYPGSVWPTTWRVCVCALLPRMRIFTQGTLLSVSSHLSVIVQWTDRVHAGAAWDSHPPYSTQISDGDNLSGSIHQATAGSGLVRPSPVSPAETYSSLPVGNECTETRSLIRRGLFNFFVGLLPNTIRSSQTFNQTKDKVERHREEYTE